MEITKTYCDKCGEEFQGDKYKNVCIVLSYSKYMDLCPKCFKELTDIIDNFLVKEGE